MYCDYGWPDICGDQVIKGHNVCHLHFAIDNKRTEIRSIAHEIASLSEGPLSDYTDIKEYYGEKAYQLAEEGNLVGLSNMAAAMKKELKKLKAGRSPSTVTWDSDQVPF